MHQWLTTSSSKANNINLKISLTHQAQNLTTSSLEVNDIKLGNLSHQAQTLTKTVQQIRSS